MYGKKTGRLLAALLSVAAAAVLIPAPSASALSPADKYFGYQWALYNDGSFLSDGTPTAAAGSVAGVDIDIESAWETYASGRPVTVALIDTGVDYKNSDLAGHIWVNPGEIPGNGVDDDKNGYVDDVNGWDFRDGNNVLHLTGEDDHGTHCFGTIAASCNGTGIAGICGYTDNVKVMVLKTFSNGGTGRTLDIVKAIKYAEDNGASIVNLSLGIDQYNQPLYDAIKNSKMLFVAAAGNDGKSSSVSPMYPADYNLDNIISVANLNYDGTLNSSSNYGPSVDIAAPGTSIIGYGADGAMYYMMGTSMAAPMVTGTAALLYSFCRSATLAQVRQIILDTASPLPALSGKVSTGGMLDAGAALKYGASLEGAAAFTDVKKSDWFYTCVTDLASRGIVSGYGDGTFRPHNSVTVGEALALILTSVGGGVEPATDAHWASGYRDKALALGIVSSADAADLNAPSTRLFIARAAAGALGLPPSSGASPFSDVNDPYVTAMYDAGYVSGSVSASGERVFLPGDSIQRCEMSVIIRHMAG